MKRLFISAFLFGFLLHGVGVGADAAQARDRTVWLSMPPVYASATLSGATVTPAARRVRAVPDRDADGAVHDAEDEDDEDEDEWEPEEDPEVQEARERASDVGYWGDPDVSSTREWTILVYHDGDNNLEGQALIDVVEMQLGMHEIDTDLVDVVVLFDRAKEYVDWDGDWTDTRVLRILPSTNEDEIQAEILHECGELNMSSPDTLENFIIEGMRMFPARRTALVLWNHGGGWQDLLSDDDAPGTEDGVDHMSLEGMRLALSRAASHYPDGKLDLLVLDMCLMGQAETLVAVAPYAQYLVASPPLAPGHGMDYHAMMPYFAEDLSTAEVAAAIAKTACQAYWEADWKDASLAAYDLSKVGSLLTSFGALARKFDTLVPIAWPHLTRSIFYAQNFGGRGDLDKKSGTTSSIDIIDWLTRLEAVSDPVLAKEFATEIEAVRNAIADIIVYGERGPLLPNSHGLAIYAPLREDNFDTKYNGNAFGAYTDWAQALTDLYVEQRDNAGSPPRIVDIEFGSPLPSRKGSTAPQIQPANAIQLGPEGVETDNRFVKITVNGTNIMWVSAGFAICETPHGPFLPVMRQTMLNSHIAVPAEAGQRVASADGEIPVFRDGRNEFVYEFFPVVHMLTDGNVRTMIYPQYVDVSDELKGEVQGQVYISVLDAWHYATLNIHGDEIVSLHAWIEDNDGNSTPYSLRPDQGDVFRPLHRFYSADGDEFIEPGDEIPWSNNLSLAKSWAGRGNYVSIICMAESLAGQGSIALGRPIQIIAEGDEVELTEPYAAADDDDWDDEEYEEYEDYEGDDDKYDEEEYDEDDDKDDIS